ncbi:MAG TPA: hypothetical protein VGB14_13780 [Acidimicrobiales bacterium]|jgi:hypothetical protein
MCATTGLPVAWRVGPLGTYWHPSSRVLLDAARSVGIDLKHVIADKGDDVDPVYDEGEPGRPADHPPLRQTPVVRAGKDRPPECEHGT